MIVELFPFQKRALALLRKQTASAMGGYRMSGINQVVAFTAPTGSGKTIIMSAFIENVLCGNDEYMEQPDAIFVWLSDSPELNLQSKDKIDTKADRIRQDKTIEIRDDNFDRELFEDGKIYFLNTQKLSRTSNLTIHSDTRQYTIWETISNTIREKSDRLYFIIDEAHRGMKGTEAGRATTIMQKFILGSEKDGLPAVPVVIGMSATIERFSQLVKNSLATQHNVKILPKEVRDSGLLKDRIIITYPENQSEQKDMAVLQAATDEWVSKTLHWETYCREQHHWAVNPIFVVQVLNGSGNVLSATDLDTTLQQVERRSGRKFEEGEVVHAFGETKGKIEINGMKVPYEEPSKINDNKRVRVVFFKETLSTGWDCPRAETMMSFRRYVDATAIAQLLGRMVRTPIQKHIMVDDMLNDVRLFLPHFDSEQVGKIVDELQNSEGGELPTDIIEDELEHSNYKMVTVRPREHSRKPETDHTMPLFNDLENRDILYPGRNVEDQGAQMVQDVAKPLSHPHTKPVGLTAPQPELPEIDFEYDGIDRQAIIEHINSLALPTYYVRNLQMNDYLKSLFQLTGFLLLSGLDTKAKERITDQIVEQIHNYIEQMKKQGRYTAAKERVMNFEMLSKVYDAFGEQIKADPVKNMFAESDAGIDLQLRIAEKKLCGEGVSFAYGRKYDDINHQDGYKVDIIIYVMDEHCLEQLHDWARHTFHQLNDHYRQKTIRLSDSLRTKYREIVRNSAEVSNTPFSFSENIAFRNDADGMPYSDHLFVDEETGYVKIKLNSWEQAVIEAERKRNDYRCWFRNPSRGRDSLTIPYDYRGTVKSFYPDFLIVRRVDGDYIVDILEPHNPRFDDSYGKAKALARYASENIAVGRAQLIKMVDTATGPKLCRLDFAAISELREKVSRINNNEELEHLFVEYGK